MPTYQYVCAANGVTVEVKHRMSESLSTWGELCAAAGMSPEGTPTDSPIAKVLTPTFVAGGGRTDNNGDYVPGTGGGGGHCHSGMCRH